MKYFSFQNLFSLRRFSLRTGLIAPLVIQVIVTVALVGYLSFKNGQEAVNDIVQQLRTEIAVRVTEKLRTFTSTPFVFNEVNAGALENFSFPLQVNEGERLSYKFWQQIRAFPTIAFGYFANAQDGRFYGASRLHHETSLTTVIANPHQMGEYSIYKTSEQGKLEENLRTVSQYEPRQRGWYKAAAEKKRPTWSSVYVSFSTRSLMITAAYPIYDATQQLLGVLGADITLADVSRFLNSLKIGVHGQSFIIDREGLLIATSSKLPPFDIENKRIAAVDFAEPTIKKAAEYLRDNVDLRHLDQPFYWRFQLNGESQFLHLTPFKDDHGLDWLFVITVPENDFMQQINANTHTTIAFCILAILLSSGFGLISTNLINAPIRKLSQAAQSIAEGKIEQHVDSSKIIELGSLTSSFNQMSEQLKISFSTLESSNLELQKARDELAATYSQLEAVLNAMPGAISWFDTKTQTYRGVNRYLAALCNLHPEDFTGRSLGFMHRTSGFTEFVSTFLQSEDLAISGELPIHLINNVPRHYLIVAQKYQNNKAAVFVSMDITERKQAEEERQRFTEQLAALNKAYERFVPNEFLSYLNKKSVVDVRLGDQIERKMTVLFSDIRDFTTISEQMTPQENINFINAYLREVSPVIREYHGFIDKYVGDAIMALFPTNADDAVMAAIGMLKRLSKFNQRRKLAGFAPLRIGIGLNTGILMLGTIGEENRMDGTVISDAVNLTSRLESMTKRYGAGLLISEHTYRHLQETGRYHIRLIDQDVKAKGKNEPLTIYEVFDGDEPEVIALKQQTLYTFEQGLRFYQQQLFTRALQCFGQVLESNPEDLAAKLYSERCLSRQQEIKNETALLPNG